MSESTTFVPGQGTRIAADVGQDGALVGVARTVESAARRAKEKLAEKKNELANKSIGELVDDGREFVRENPGKTILISVGVGALVGYLIGRRRSS
jgi:ElaB/YqjD/DUF883 family membrane-anchored ribosome-binding protein